MVDLLIKSPSSNDQVTFLNFIFGNLGKTTSLSLNVVLLLALQLKLNVTT